MSSGQGGPESRESNAAVIVAVVLAALLIPALFLCGGAALLYWTVGAPSIQPMPVVEAVAVPVDDVEDWAARAEVGLQTLEPEDTLSWLRVAPLVVLAGDESQYRDFCGRMAEQFAGTEDVQTAERTCKACLLTPDGIALDELPHMTLAKSLDDGTAPEEIAAWLWSARSLVAYRSGDAESAVVYARQAEELNPTPMAEALLLSIRACALYQLDELEEWRSDVNRAHEVIDGILKSNPSSSRHHDILMAKILLQEAEAATQGQAAAKPADTGTDADPPSVPEASKLGGDATR